MKALTFIVVSFVVALGSGCERSERTVRQYREVSMIADQAAPTMPPASMPAANVPPVAAASQGAMPDLPAELKTPSLPLAWTTPEGWEEVPGSGMRIATWNVEGQECTLMSFPGDVGGDEANIRRWIGQTGQSVPEDALKTFIASPVPFTTEGGQEGRLFDFSLVLPEASPTCILAGIIPVDDQSVFIKFMGDASIVRKHKAEFEALCRSIRL